MYRALFICLILLAACLPASAFVDRNGVTSAAQFSDYVPASYLKKAGVTDDMNVVVALDKYIAYALSFSDKTSYAYIARLTNPSRVQVRSGAGNAAASRGDAVPPGASIEVGDGAMAIIRYPGGVSHTIYGPYTYTVPAYGAWGSSATFGMQEIVIPDTTGYTPVTKEVECRSNSQSTIEVMSPVGNVYAFTTNPQYTRYQPEVITGKSYLSDYHVVVTGPGSSALVTHGLDTYRLKEMSVFSISPKMEECVRVTYTIANDTSGTTWVTNQEPTIIDEVRKKVEEVYTYLLKLLPIEEDFMRTPTATLGKRA